MLSLIVQQTAPQRCSHQTCAGSHFYDPNSKFWFRWASSASSKAFRLASRFKQAVKELDIAQRLCNGRNQDAERAVGAVLAIIADEKVLEIEDRWTSFVEDTLSVFAYQRQLSLCGVSARPNLRRLLTTSAAFDLVTQLPEFTKGFAKAKTEIDRIAAELTQETPS